MIRPSASSTITSQKSRTNNLIVLVEFFLNFTSNNSFQLFLNVSIKLGALKARKDWFVI